MLVLTNSKPALKSKASRGASGCHGGLFFSSRGADFNCPIKGKTKKNKVAQFASVIISVQSLSQRAVECCAFL